MVACCQTTFAAALQSQSFICRTRHASGSEQNVRAQSAIEHCASTVEVGWSTRTGATGESFKTNAVTAHGNERRLRRQDVHRSHTNTAVEQTSAFHPVNVERPCCATESYIASGQFSRDPGS